MLAAAGVTALIGPGGIAAQAATPAKGASAAQWRVAGTTRGGPSQEFDGVTAPAKDDAWAVGTTNRPLDSPGTPVFAHWNGKSWSGVTIKASAGLYFSSSLFGPVNPALSSSPGNVWFFGASKKTKLSEALVYNGRSWRVQPLPSDFAIPLAVVGPANVWAKSTDTCPGTYGCTVLLHWNGRTWSHVSIEGSAPVASAAAGHAWIMTIPVGGVNGEGIPSGTPVVYKTTGNALGRVKVPAQSYIYEDNSGIVAAPNGQLWILNSMTGGNDHLYHWTGRKWTTTAVPGGINYNGLLSYDGKNGFWVGEAAHWTGGKWINTDSLSKRLADANLDGAVAAIPGTAGVWGAGSDNRTAYSTNAVIAVYGPLP